MLRSVSAWMMNPPLQNIALLSLLLSPLLPLPHLPLAADVFTRSTLPPPTPPGENESRSIAPPE